jgi:hypothetical protein
VLHLWAPQVMSLEQGNASGLGAAVVAGCGCGWP